MASIGKGSRIKGSNFERKIAKKLSEWLGIRLRRTPNSGGLNIKSDIITEDLTELNKLPFHFELKCQERWNVRDYFTQAQHDCMEGKIPTVIFTRNNDDTFIMMKLDDFMNFTKDEVKKLCQNT